MSDNFWRAGVRAIEGSGYCCTCAACGDAEEFTPIPNGAMVYFPGHDCDGNPGTGWVELLEHSAVHD